MFCEEKKVVKRRLKKKRGDAEHHTACRLLRDSTRCLLQDYAASHTLPLVSDLIPCMPQSYCHVLCAALLRNIRDPGFTESGNPSSVPLC